MWKCRCGSGTPDLSVGTFAPEIQNKKHRGTNQKFPVRKEIIRKRQYIKNLLHCFLGLSIVRSFTVSG
jgi:hypothetical protein